MTVKEHYDNHLAGFYSWMLGNFDTAKNSFRDYCTENHISPETNATAIDLGAGNGIHTIALAESGYRVKAIDFNKKLLSELKSRIGKFPVKLIYDDIVNIKTIVKDQPVDLITCCGDTISHIETFRLLDNLFQDCYDSLKHEGRFVISFRDYSFELTDTQRFIPVKSDDNKILTCILDYFKDRVRVTDLLYEKEDNRWVQKVSSYHKLRVTSNSIIKKTQEIGFSLVNNTNVNGMIHLILQK
jgi:2-polyprenyl-3-methyl-5-hydroxy-6-metoxy-1,4-benzoquinol methylase